MVWWIWFYEQRRFALYVISPSDSENAYLVLPNTGPSLHKLPNLSTISWPQYKRPNYTRTTTGSGFNLKLSEGQHESLQYLLREFERIMISLELHDQWFLGAGTLLGSLRHHDIIPWDDDLDVYVDLRHRTKIQSALRNLPSIFGTHTLNLMDKIFFKPIGDKESVNSSTIGSFKVPNWPWAWPFLDIFYFKYENAKKVVDVTWERFAMTPEQIFPVTYRPYGQRWYPAPRNPISLLTAFFASDRHLCMSSDYSHAKETGIPSYSVNCSALFNRYAFVLRCPVGTNRSRDDGLQYCDEYLVGGDGRCIHKIRTLLDPTEIASPFFTAQHNLFSCP